MSMRAWFLFGFLVLVSSAALAQDAGGPGAGLYEENCALCHQPDGAGDPPTFPALVGNTLLSDAAKIVANIHQGQGDMPPFPDLTAEELAALASYVRNAWTNDFGAVTADEVGEVLAGLESPEALRSVWDGVYTIEQADRGRSHYTGPCSLCHGRRLDGAPDDPDMRPAPPLARVKFLREWDRRSLAALYEYSRATMPQSNPGYMSDEMYVEIIAHMLAESDIPAGSEALPTDPKLLSRIIIQPEP